MTTIAYRDGVLASESLVVEYNTRLGFDSKIFKNKKGMLGGASGDSGDCEVFRKWFMRGAAGSPPKFKEETEAIVISSAGEVKLVDKNGVKSKYSARFYALGCGYRLALGAMAAGVDAKRAVEIACEFDCSSGGPIQIFELDSKKYKD